MRFVLNFTIFALIVFFFFNIAKNDIHRLEEENACQTVYESGNYDESLKCYNALYKKHKLAFYKFNAALSCYYKKDFLQARKNIDTILINEKNDSEIRQRAIEFLNIISKKETNVQKDKKYYIDLANTIVWSNPKNIKVYIFQDELKSKNFVRAFQSWDDALGGYADFEYVQNPQEADITCEFADEIPQNADFIGVAISRYTKSEKNENKKFFESVQIKVLRKSPLTGLVYNDNEIYATALHEIGHALGIDIHSPYVDDIMYANTDGQMYREAQLSEHDIAMVRRLYEYLP